MRRTIIVLAAIPVMVFSLTLMGCTESEQTRHKTHQTPQTAAHEKHGEAHEHGEIEHEESLIFTTSDVQQSGDTASAKFIVSSMGDEQVISAELRVDGKTKDVTNAVDGDGTYTLKMEGVEAAKKDDAELFISAGEIE